MLKYAWSDFSSKQHIKNAHCREGFNKEITLSVVCVINMDWRKGSYISI